MNYSSFLLFFLLTLTSCMDSSLNIKSLDSKVGRQSPNQQPSPNTKRTKPVLQRLDNFILKEGDRNFSIDIDNEETEGDLDSNGFSLEYKCFFDREKDLDVKHEKSCEELEGLSFDTINGIFIWKPSYLISTSSSDNQIFEFLIIASSGEFSDEIVFSINIENVYTPNDSKLGEWIEVPSRSEENEFRTFWVMKYEAKALLDNNKNDEFDSNEAVDNDGCGDDECKEDNWGLEDHFPISIDDGSPWRKISPENAQKECESLGSGFNLITNLEWMAIARSIETNEENWTGGDIGMGCLARGNSGEVTSGENHSLGNSCGFDGDNPHTNFSDNRASHKLSSGDEIFNFSGNVWEWIDWDDPRSLNPGIQQMPNDCKTSKGFIEFNEIECGNQIAENEYLPQTSSLDSDHGIGRMYFDSEAQGTMASRGGGWTTQESVGIYALIAYGQGGAFPQTGFRCVYRPK